MSLQVPIPEIDRVKDGLSQANRASRDKLSSDEFKAMYAKLTEAPTPLTQERVEEVRKKLLRYKMLGVYR